MVSFLPGGGIRITFLFFLYYYNLFSIYICVAKEPVLAEKVISKEIISPLSVIFYKVSLTIIVLPVPVKPVKNVGYKSLIFLFKNQLKHTVSFVGTTKSKKLIVVS
jgi:hypothetical protein